MGRAKASSYSRSACKIINHGFCESPRCHREIPARSRQSKQKCSLHVKCYIGSAEAMPSPVLQRETTSRGRAAWLTTLRGARSPLRAGPRHRACSMSRMPLRVALWIDNFAIAHVNNAITIGGGFWIVSDHENRLSEFLVGVAQHVQHNL